MKVGDKTVFDLETMFLHLLMVGQKRQLQMASIFQHELCTIPRLPTEGNTYILANHLRWKQVSAPAPDIVIVDKQKMLCHIVTGTPLTSVKK